MKLAHAKGFDQSDSLAGLNRQTTNCYPKYFPGTDLAGQPVMNEQLYGTPGIHFLNNDDVGDATTFNRGSTTTGGITYYVAGTVFKRFNADFTITSFASIPIKGSNQVSMSDNCKQILIISPDSGEGYIFDVAADTLSRITDAGFVANGRPQYGIFINSFFMVTTDTKRFTISDINNGFLWDVNDFGTAETNPDPIVAPLNFKNVAYIFGSETVEGHEFSPSGTDFPYVHNRFILDKGLFSPLSLEVSSNTFMYVGGAKDEAPAIWSLVGNKVVRISNTGVDLKLEALTPIELSQVTSFSYMLDGSYFIGWRLPLETVVFEQTTGVWHLRRSLDVGWRAINLVSAYDKLICFDPIDGRIGEVSNDFFDEYGEDILREFDIEPIRQDRTITIPRLEVQIEAGVGSATNDPKLRVKFTRDGQSFGGEQQLTMGKIGEFLKRLVKRRNGRYPQYCGMRFLCSEQVKFVIIRVEAEILGGNV